MTKWLPFILRNGGVLFTVWLVGNALADNAKISYPPVPDWVHEMEWTDATNGLSNPKSSGTRYLLYEAQDRPKKAEEFVRVVELMENANGVQDSGSLRFSFDPDFQELCLHVVAIHRAGKTINRLDPAQVRLIQPEPGLNGDVITGHQTAVLFVEDLRVGDVLEYAYTIRGSNPVLQGHYSTRFTIQSDSPVDRELFRVVWDDSTPLSQRMHSLSVKPAIIPGDVGFEYDWGFTNLAAIPDEDCQPASFEPYPYVDVSDFSDWRSVVNWALPLYEAGPTNLPPEMQQLLTQWENSAGSDEERARLALEFVQDDLRYTGIELGPDSYRPADPVDTFQKRFGDCKGKSVLLQFLLKQMNIESHPALVDSSGHEAVAGRLPSPFAFDHCILELKLAGKDVWVDPTASHQGGSIWNRHLSPFGKALVIRPGNQDLEDVPGNRPENAWHQSVTSTFTVHPGASPAELTVLTMYNGASADDMRYQIASNDPNDLAKNYLNYYTRLYPGITGSQPLKIIDDRKGNVVTVKESYSLTNLWKRDESDGLEKASFYADGLYGALTDPNTRIRKTPLALIHPLFRRHEVIVHLPDTGWQISDLTTNIEDPAFSFKYHRHLAGSTVTFDYECQTKMDAVPVESVPNFLVARSHLDDLLVDTLQRPGVKTSPGVNWLMVAIALFGTGATAFGCVWFWRSTNAGRGAPPVLAESPDPLRGLGGWLILVAIGLCLGPLMRISIICQNGESYFSAQVWQVVAMPQGSSYHPLYGPLLMLELLGNIFFLGLGLLAIGLFFARRKEFPRVYITLLLGFAAFAVLDDVGCLLIPKLRATADAKDHSEVIRAACQGILWSCYMLKSKRVKLTFTR